MRLKYAAVLFVALLFLSCSRTSDVVEIQFWNFGGMPKFLDWVRKEVQIYNAAHPKVKVVLAEKSWHQIREILYAGFSAGAGPDIMTLHADHTAEFGAGGFFYPLNNFPDFEHEKQRFETHLMESTKYKGNYYGLPSAGIVFILVCNKQLFDAEGIAPPKTWSEFRAAAKRLTKDLDGDGSIDQYGLVLLGGDKGGFSYRLAPFLMRAGVKIMSEDGTFDLNSPRAVATVKLFADMNQIDHSVTPGFLAYTLSEINDLFCSNKVAMSIEGPWFEQLVTDKNPGKEFYTVAVPVPDDMIDQYKNMPSLQDMVMYPINAYSKHLAETWDFLKFIRSDEADMLYIDRQTGGLPTTLKVLNSPDCAKRKAWDVYDNEIKHSTPWPAHPQIIPIAKNILAPYAEKAIIGEMTPQAAMDAAVKEAQALLEESK
jgi:ABC-type glycerol-3-phosphate transport system substrate-binding protein